MIVMFVIVCFPNSGLLLLLKPDIFCECSYFRSQWAALSRKTQTHTHTQEPLKWLRH